MLDEEKDAEYRIPDIMLYQPENLNPNNKRVYDCLEKNLNRLLGDEVIEDYFSEFYDRDCHVMKRTRSLISEQLLPFLQYLREKADSYKLDVIFDSIECYDDDISQIMAKVKLEYDLQQKGVFEK